MALASGLVLLGLMFAGAAVVVLERFARQVRRLRSVAIAALLVAGMLTFVALQTEVPGVFEHGDELASALPLSLGASLAIVAIATALVRAVLRFAAPRTLARIGVGRARRRPGARAPIAADRVARSSDAEPARRPRLHDARQASSSFVLLGLAPLALAGFLDLRGSAEWFIASRYLVAKRRQTFISVITGICVAGVAAGVWLIITVLSVMNGFERTWREEIIGNRAHFTVNSGLGSFGDYQSVLDRVLEQPGVVAASPFVQAEGMVRGDNGEIVGVRLQGIDPARIGDVTDLRDELIAGSLEALIPPPSAEGEAADPGLVVGDELARALGVHVGDPILLISPFGGPPTPLGASPRLMRFQVAGVFRSSVFQGDEIVTYANLRAAQNFKRVEDVVDGIEARTTDYYRSARIAESVQAELGFPYYTRDWKEFFPAFFQALKTERIMMFVLLTMIMVVAAFAIVVTLIMMIMEKSSDIAILKAMGARDAAIERIFAIEGALIGLTGTVIGVVTGIAVTARLDWIQHRVEDLTGIDALPASVYQGISELPAQLDAVQIAAVVGIAMALALGGTWIPSRQGARLDPVEALRYE